MDPIPRDLRSVWRGVCGDSSWRQEKTPMSAVGITSPAGEERAVIARASLQPLYPKTPRTKKLWSYRLNKVSVGTSGQMIIDDAFNLLHAGQPSAFPARPIPDERNQPFLCPVSPTDEA